MMLYIQRPRINKCLVSERWWVPWGLPELLLWLPLSAWRYIALRGWALSSSEAQVIFFLRIVQRGVIQLGGTPSQGPGGCFTHHSSSVTAACLLPSLSLVKTKFLSGPRSFPESEMRETIPGNRGRSHSTHFELRTLFPCILLCPALPTWSWWDAMNFPRKKFSW